TVVTVHPQPNVTVFDPAFGAPRTWRASLGVQQRVFTGYTVSLDASYARGVNQYGFRDVNLGPARFALPEEGGRAVFVPLDSIGSAGEKDFTASRAYPGYGRVLVIGSDLQSESRQYAATTARSCSPPPRRPTRPWRAPCADCSRERRTTCAPASRASSVAWPGATPAPGRGRARSTFSSTIDPWRSGSTDGSPCRSRR